MNYDEVASISDSIREYVTNYGQQHPEYQWINTPQDTWEENPYYTGTVDQPHPESL